jgi:uncharacterized protein (DUF302 family)
MAEKTYAIRTTTTLSHAEAVEKTTAELKKEGFGVLTTIDVRATLKAKIGADFPPYVILGACSPTHALRTLTADKDVGVFLPCNVLVYEEGGKTVISAMNPLEAMASVKNDALLPVANEVTEKLRRVIARMA